MAAPDTDPLHDQFVELLDEGAQALAAGSPWYPENDPAVPQQLVPELQKARRCLALLQALWPQRTAGDTTQPDDPAQITSTDFQVGDGLPRIGRYAMLGELGRGGMGVVYRAWQTDLRRPVALKMILAGAHAGPQLRQRFRREAELAAALHHPNIVQIHEIDEHDSCPYFSQEYMDGGTLADYIKEHLLSPREAAEVVATLAQAVQFAHESNVIHRDLKPSNVLLRHRTGSPRPKEMTTVDTRPVAEGRLLDQYFVKVGDFGLARELDDDATRTGVVLGTPAYMAPEQADGKNGEVDFRTDVYSLGVILYELLTGRQPFKGKTHADTLERVKRDEPVPPRRHRRAVPRDLQAICLKCLEKSPRRRYASAQALADDLGRWQRGERPLARSGRIVRWARWLRRYAAALGIGLAVGSGAAAAFFWDPERPRRELEKALAQNAPVTLIGESGAPKWFQILIGADKTQVSPASDGGWGVHSWADESFVVLAPSSGHDHFRFSALIHHEKYEINGAVGLFAGLRKLPGEGNTEHLMVVLEYNDVESPATRRKPMPPIGNSRLVDTNRLTLGGYFYGIDARRGLLFDHSMPAACDYFKPAGFSNQIYRQVELVVGPEEVTAYWEGREVGQETSDRFVHLLKNQARGIGRQDLLATPLAFDCRGGAGLYVRLGSASFKNVTITPLGEAQ